MAACLTHLDGRKADTTPSPANGRDMGPIVAGHMRPSHVAWASHPTWW